MGLRRQGESIRQREMHEYRSRGLQALSGLVGASRMRGNAHGVGRRLAVPTKTANCVSAAEKCDALQCRVGTRHKGLARGSLKTVAPSKEA
jgi:hypothetical protein